MKSFFAIAATATLLAGCTSPAVKEQQRRTAAERDPQRHLADLVAQCPPDPRLSPAAEANLPIERTKAGTIGPKILVLHGGEKAINAIGGGPKNFEKQLPLGNEGWQITVPSRPGFGNSPSRGRDDQIADLRWIVPILKASGGTHLWGHSFGGAEALLAAARTPGSVRSLVLIEPDLWSMEEALPPSQQPPNVATERRARIDAVLSSDSPQAYMSNFLATFQPKKSGTKVWLMRKAIDIAPGLGRRVGCGLLLGYEASGHELLDAVRIVRDAGIPVLVVTGGWDPGRDSLGEFAAKLLGGRHVIVRSDDHIVMHDNPADFNRTVAQFMTDADRRHGGNQR